MNIFLLLTIAGIITGTVVTPIKAMELIPTNPSSSNSSLVPTSSLVPSLSSTHLSSTSTLSSLTSSPVLTVTKNEGDSDSDDARNPNTVGKKLPAASSGSETSFDDDDDTGSESGSDFDDDNKQDQFVANSPSSSSSSSTAPVPSSTDIKDDKGQERPRSSSISDEQSPPVERSIRARSFSSSNLIKKIISKKEDPSTACSSASSSVSSSACSSVSSSACSSVSSSACSSANSNAPSETEEIWHVGPITCTRQDLYNAYFTIAKICETTPIKIFFIQFCNQQRNKRLEKMRQHFMGKTDANDTYTIPTELQKEFLKYHYKLCDSNFTLTPLAQYLIPSMISPSGKIILLQTLKDLKIIQCDTDIKQAIEDEFNEMGLATQEKIKRYKKEYPQATRREIKKLENDLSLAALNNPRWKITIHNKVFFLRESWDEIVSTYKKMSTLNKNQRASIDRLIAISMPPQKGTYIRICDGLKKLGLLWDGSGYKVASTITGWIAEQSKGKSPSVTKKTAALFAKFQQLSNAERQCLENINLNKPLNHESIKIAQRLKKLGLIKQEYIVPPLVRRLHIIGSAGGNEKIGYMAPEEFEQRIEMLARISDQYTN